MEGEVLVLLISSNAHALTEHIGPLLLLVKLDITTIKYSLFILFCFSYMSVLYGAFCVYSL